MAVVGKSKSLTIVVSTALILFAIAGIVGGIALIKLATSLSSVQPGGKPPALASHKIGALQIVSATWHNGYAQQASVKYPVVVVELTVTNRGHGANTGAMLIAHFRDPNREIPSGPWGKDVKFIEFKDKIKPGETQTVSVEFVSRKLQINREELRDNDNQLMLAIAQFRDPSIAYTWSTWIVAEWNEEADEVSEPMPTTEGF